MNTGDNKTKFDNIIDQIEWQIEIGVDLAMDEEPNNRLNFDENNENIKKIKFNSDQKKTSEDKAIEGNFVSIVFALIIQRDMYY